jgi:hypothetical protein
MILPNTSNILTSFRSDWANAGRETVAETRNGLSNSPLRYAARSGSIESVRYFLSDKPYQFYSDFGSSSIATRDPYIRLLNKVPDGYNRAVSKWLKSDRTPTPPMLEKRYYDKC